MSGAPTSSRADQPLPPPRPRLDRAVAWSVALLLASFPLMLLLLVGVSWVVTLQGYDPASEAGAERLRALNLPYMVLSLVPLVGAGVLGAHAWRRRRRLAGLVVALLASVAAVGFVLFPLVVSRAT